MNPPAMPARLRFYLLSSVCFFIGLSACTSESRHENFVSRVVPLTYDDFGPESMAKPLLGPRGTNTRVIVYHGATRSALEHHFPTSASGTPDYRFITLLSGIYHLQREIRHLPMTPENEPLRQRLRQTYSRLYTAYNKRRLALVSTPPFFGRGAVWKSSIMPPIAPPM